MFPIAHFIKGYLKNLFNPHISNFAFVSANNVIHPKATIYRMCKVKKSEIGAYSYCGNDTDVECAKIGKFTSISDHCRIGMGKHTLDCMSTSPIFTEAINGTQTSWIDRDCHAAPVEYAIVGNDVWIGSHVLVAGGVTIGDGAVVAAGAVVTAKLIEGVTDSMQLVVIASMVSAIIAGIIIFGKAMGKKIAMDNCDKIVLTIGRLVYIFTFGKLSLKNKNTNKQ